LRRENRGGERWEAGNETRERIGKNRSGGREWRREGKERDPSNICAHEPLTT